MVISLGRETIENLVGLCNACTDDPTRFALNHIQINKGRAWGCDGHIMAWYDDKGLGELSVAIDKDDMKLFKKDSVVTIDTDDMTLSNGAIRVKLHKFVASAEKLHAGMTEHDGIFTATKEYDTFNYTMSFNPLLLSRLAKAVGCHKHRGLRLIGKDSTAPIQVRFDGEWRGVIMPMRM